MYQHRPYCLSIAGNDPCGGAGLLADIKVFEQLKVYGLGVVSALTWQNDSQLNGLQWCSYSDIEKQLLPLQKYNVKVVKIGVIENFALLENVVDLLMVLFPDVFIIWDPILRATAGFSFNTENSIGKKLYHKIGLITPNTEEFEQLNISSESTSVLLKGGHNKQNRGNDILYHNKKEILIEGVPFEGHINKHGTGCVLSSAIAANIAKGSTLVDACIEGKRYVENFMLSNTSNLGYHH